MKQDHHITFTGKTTTPADVCRWVKALFRLHARIAPRFARPEPRRIPTQLLESLLAGILGLGVLVVILSHGPAGGALFAAWLAAYTLGRQGILHLRAEQRKTRLGGLVTASLAALVLVAALVVLAR